MIPKMGDKNTYHFAHKTDAVCAPNNALHETAKAYIIKQFRDVSRIGTDYTMSIPCSECRRQVTEYNLTASGASKKPETSVIEETRSDLVVFWNDGATLRTIIEVVVTHELESNTRDAYLKSGVPVIIVRSSWSDLSRIRNTLNVVCKACATRTGDLGRFMSDGPRDLGAPPKKITADRNGRVLYPQTKTQG